MALWNHVSPANLLLCFALNLGSFATKWSLDRPVMDVIGYISGYRNRRQQALHAVYRDRTGYVGIYPCFDIVYTNLPWNSFEADTGKLCPLALIRSRI